MIRISGNRERIPRASTGSGLQGLGCGKTAPCDDIGRICYRLEWYTLVWFDHKGQYNGENLTVQQYLIIIYQSWLQLIMIDQKQDLSGSIFKNHGIFGTQYFIAFGGSDDSRKKQPETAYFLDSRFNSKCNGSGKDFLDRGYYISRLWFTDQVIPANSKFGILSTGKWPLTDYIQFMFNIELNFYAVDYQCTHGLKLTDNMLQLFISPVTAVVSTFAEVIKYYKETDSQLITADKKITDIKKQVIDPIQKTQEAEFQNTAIMYGGFTLASLAIGVMVLKAVNKDGRVPLWQLGILGVGGVIAGKKVLEKFSQQSTYFKDNAASS